MANWALLQEQLTGLPVVKRARHGIHFDKGNGEIVANFSGKPCHYEDKGVWKPIDTGLLLANDGFYGCPHSPVKVHKDGRVKVDKSDYSQFAKLPGSPLGRLDGDKIVRDFPGGYQELFVTEDGFREVITVVKPTFPIEKFLAKQSGTLPSIYRAHPQTAVDANGDVFEITSDTKAFGDWLEGAVYPVTIDPDFTGANADAYIRGGDADYATARLTASYYNNSETTLPIGQFLLTGTYYIYRGFVVFDTSSIDDGATITQVNLKATCNVDISSGVDFDVQIVKYDWSQWESGQSNATYRETAYDGCLSADADDNVLVNTSYLASNTQYTSGNLSTSWVSKTGKTYYGLRSSNDVAATAPAGQDYMKIYSNNSSTESYRPVLSVTYTTGSTGVPKHFLHYARLRSN